MPSLTISISLVFVFLSVELIATDSKNKYDKEIITIVKRIASRANNRTYRENAELSDSAAIPANLGYIPRSYYNTIAGNFEGAPEVFKNAIQGMKDQQDKEKKGNILDRLLDMVRGATFGAETGMQKDLAHSMARVLRDGEDPKTSENAEAMDSDIDQMLKLGIEKRKEEDARRGNIPAILHNTWRMFTFAPMVLSSDVQQLFAYIKNILKDTVQDGEAGMKKGGLPGGFIGALKGATTGINTGYQNAYAAVLGTGMRENFKQKPIVSPDH